MKKLFAILFSFQLIIAPVASAVEEDQYYITGDGSSEGNSQYLDTIMTTGSGIIGAGFIGCTAKSYTFSHYIFMAGALVLLLSEIFTAEAQKAEKEDIAKQMERQGLSQQKPGDFVTQEQKDAQLTLLNAALKEEKVSKDYLKQRADWLTAAEVVYWLAVAGAAVEIVLYALSTYTGYDDWSLDCQDQNDTLVMAVGAAYGALPGLVQGDVSGALMNGISVVTFYLLLQKITKMAGSTIKNAVNSAPGRLVIFGVFAYLASDTRSGLRDRQELAEKNIKRLEGLIEDWTKASTTSTQINTDIAATVGGASGGANAAPVKPTVKPLPKTKVGKCAGASGSTLSVSAESCANPYKFNRKFPKVESQTIAQGFNDSANLGDAWARDDLAAAQTSADALVSNAAKIKKEALNLVKAANDKLKAKGEKTIDFDKKVKAQLAAFKKQAQDIGKQHGMKSLGTVAKSEPSVSAPAADKSEVAAPAVVAPVAPEQKGVGDFVVGAADETSLMDANANMNGATPVDMDEFDVNRQDISKKSEVSIFKQITNRYFLNYTKIFDRKKGLEVAEEPKKK